LYWPDNNIHKMKQGKNNLLQISVSSDYNPGDYSDLPEQVVHERQRSRTRVASVVSLPPGPAGQCLEHKHQVTPPLTTSWHQHKHQVTPSLTTSWHYFKVTTKP